MSSIAALLLYSASHFPFCSPAHFSLQTEAVSHFTHFVSKSILQRYKPPTTWAWLDDVVIHHPPSPNPPIHPGVIYQTSPVICYVMPLNLFPLALFNRSQANAYLCQYVRVQYSLSFEDHKRQPGKGHSSVLCGLLSSNLLISAAPHLFQYIASHLNPRPVPPPSIIACTQTFEVIWNILPCFCAMHCIFVVTSNH